MSLLSTRGRHVLLDLWGCDPATLGDAARLEALMRRAAESCDATVLETSFRRFSPAGVSGVLVIAESHLSIHTWPEEGFAAADFYTCGDSRPEAAAAVLRDGLAAERVEILVVDRGRGPGPRSMRTVEARELGAPGAGAVDRG